MKLDDWGGSNLLIYASEKPVLGPAVVWDDFRLWNWDSSSSTDNKVTLGGVSASSSQIKTIK